jgi:RNA polymerase sigma-70 factor (ECF subfamily)
LFRNNRDRVPSPVGIIVNHSRHNGWFDEQILPHEGALRAWLVSRFHDVDEIDDLVQETYMRVLAAREKGVIVSPKAFLFATARNLALDRVRRSRIVTIDPVAEVEELSVYDEGPSAPDCAARRQELELLTRAIQNLPDRCRQVITLRKIYGLSQKEIAARLGISEHTVEAQVGNGVRRCAEFLARFGLP